MKIEYYDGSVLTCRNVEVVDNGNTLIADDIYIVPIAEVSRITQEDVNDGNDVSV